MADRGEMGIFEGYGEEDVNVEDTEGLDKGIGVYCVSVFLVDKSYGGPEEGGWYYSVGAPVLEPNLPLPKFTTFEDVARAWQREMQVELDDNFNKYRPSISSVASQGRYSAIVSEGWPESFPKVRPHYE